MKKAIAILLIIVAAFFGTLLYFHAHDTRTADSLSAYARIEFTGLRGSDGSATSGIRATTAPRPTPRSRS